MSTNGNEQWKAVKGYEDFYEISDLGRIRSRVRKIIYPSGRIEYRKARLLVTTINKHNGYSYVGLYDGNKTPRCFRFHRLVAQNFLENPDNLPEVNHEDFDKQNNAATNLKWCDSFYQQQHAAKKPGRKWGLTGVRRIGKDNCKSKPVVALDAAGKELGRFESGNLAAAALNCQQAKVSMCCQGKRSSHKGYRFQFA